MRLVTELGIVRWEKSAMKSALRTLRVVLQPFPGQTEQAALARARPIVKEMEKRVRSVKDLTD